MVVGAGVVGLAIAREIAQTGRSVVLIERHETFGRELSSRHSEVLHAGLYYEPDSIKATTCVRGRELLVSFCQTRGIALEQVGKLVVATREEQLSRLEALRLRALANGVCDVELWDQETVARSEPELRCVAALYSPSSGILDSHGVMAGLESEALEYGVTIAYRTPFLSSAITSRGFTCELGGREPSRVKVKSLINTAGLGALEVANRIEGLSAGHLPRRWLAKGNYFHVQQPNPFSHLIYPLPESGGLGIHLTWDLAGRGRAGPDVEWVERVDFRVSDARVDRFYASVRRYWPGLRDGALTPESASIRPKLYGPGMSDADFVIQGVDEHGVPGLVNLYGIESPGLTASMALAEHVSRML